MPLGAIDLGDVAALLTAVLTVAIIALTYLAVRAARVSAAAAARAAEAAERQVQEAHRPVLIPLSDLRDAEETRQPFELPLQNVGSGAALNVFGRAHVRGIEHGPFALAPVPSVAPDHVEHLRFNGHSVTTKKLFKVVVTYTDVAGTSYTTEASWDPREQRFGHTVVKTGDHARAKIPIGVVARQDRSSLRRLLDRLRRRPPAPAPDGGPPLEEGDIVIGAGEKASVVRRRDRERLRPDKP